MSKIDIGPKYRNLFYWPYEVLSSGPNAHPNLSIDNTYGSPGGQGWHNGTFNTPVYMADSANEKPDYNQVNTSEGRGGLYRGDGSPSVTFLCQPYPYSGSTKYRASIWYKVNQMYIGPGPSPLSYANAIKVMSGPTCLQTTSIPFGVGRPEVSYVDQKWIQYSLIWTTSDQPLNCTRRQVYFLDGVPTELERIWIWGAELNVLEPGPNFFTDWPDLRNQLTY